MLRRRWGTGTAVAPGFACSGSLAPVRRWDRRWLRRPLTAKCRSHNGAASPLCSRGRRMIIESQFSAHVTRHVSAWPLFAQEYAQVLGSQGRPRCSKRVMSTRASASKDVWTLR